MYYGYCQKKSKMHLKERYEVITSFTVNVEV